MSVPERRQLSDRRCRNCLNVSEDAWEEDDGTDVCSWHCDLTHSFLMIRTYGSSHEEWAFDGTAPENCPLTERCPACWLNTVARPDGKTTVAGQICSVCGGVGSVTPERFFTWALEQNEKNILNATIIREEDPDAVGT